MGVAGLEESRRAAAVAALQRAQRAGGGKESAPTPAPCPPDTRSRPMAYGRFLNVNEPKPPCSDADERSPRPWWGRIVAWLRVEVPRDD